MNKLLLWIFAGLFGVAAAIGAYFVLYNKVDGDPWKMIPDTPAIIIQTNQARDIYEQLGQENDIWTSLLKTSEFTKLQLQINMLDSLLINETAYHLLLWQRHAYSSI